MMNTCYYHPNLPASSVCTRCGRKICVSCSKPYGALALCPTCFHTLPTQQMGPAPATVIPTGPPVMAPTGYPVAYPHAPTPYLVSPFWAGLRSRWLPVILVGVGAALIFANAGALLWPSFFAVWTAWLPWVGFIGNFGFILGVMLGLILLGAIILMLLNYRVMSAFVIFPTAIVSFFIGGGFVLGALLAVLAGILLIL